MTIRNLFFSFMIFCTMPSGCLFSEESLTEEEQSKLILKIWTEHQQDDADAAIKAYMKESPIFEPEEDISFKAHRMEVLTHKTPTSDGCVTTEVVSFELNHSCLSVKDNKKRRWKDYNRKKYWWVAREEDDDEVAIIEAELADLKKALTFMLEHLDSSDVVLQYKP